MTDLLSQLLDLAPEINKTNREKGFWPENRNKPEQIMLVISELGECLDAHRHNKFAKLQDFDLDVLEGHVIAEDQVEGYKMVFESKVKDTVEDELADAAIRHMDYIYGWGKEVRPLKLPLPSLQGNFGADLLQITDDLVQINRYTPVPEDDSLHLEMKYRMSQLIDGGMEALPLRRMIIFANYYKLDILSHVRWKMKYNKTRPYKHGRNY